MSKRTLIILAVSAFIVVLTIAVAVDGLYRDNSSAPKSFAFRLSSYPNNGTVMQSQNLTINVDVVYLEGQPEPVTLSANGGPNATLYKFNNPTGTPNNTQPFSSALTIVAPTSAASETYPIAILATTGKTTYQNTFNLAIINSQIQVNGTVTGTHVDIAGQPSEDVYPTDIIFKSTSTNQTYETKVHLPTDVNGKPMKTGNYSIMLPNQQTYRVSCYCFSYPHFIPVFRVSIGNENGYFTVSVGAGVNSTVANFTG